MFAAGSQARTGAGADQGTPVVMLKGRLATSCTRKGASFASPLGSLSGTHRSYTFHQITAIHANGRLQHMRFYTDKQAACK